LKKKISSILFALALVLSFSLVTAVPVAAWDVEDPCVASNEDFIWGIGWDGDTAESYYGEQSWSFFETPNDGYNLYRDDVTGTGNLDKIDDLITRTPGAITGLLIEFVFPEIDGGLWYMGDEGSNKYYWALEPRGYNYPDIDIKPGSDPNSINLKSKGVVPVAVLTTADFDASTVDPAAVLFVGASPVRSIECDVDDDGDLDILFHFKTQDLNLDENSTEATLTGMTYGGQTIQGTDAVNIVPKEK